MAHVQDDGVSRRDREIAQGLRDEGGSLVGGLVVEDYNRGIDDFEAGIIAKGLTSTSYDLGRARAARQRGERDAGLATIKRDGERRTALIRKMLADRPDALADFDAKMAELARDR